MQVCLPLFVLCFLPRRAVSARPPTAPDLDALQQHKTPVNDGQKYNPVPPVPAGNFQGDRNQNGVNIEKLPDSSLLAGRWTPAPINEYQARNDSKASLMSAGSTSRGKTPQAGTWRSDIYFLDSISCERRGRKLAAISLECWINIFITIDKNSNQEIDLDEWIRYGSGKGAAIHLDKNHRLFVAFRRLGCCQMPKTRSLSLESFVRAFSWADTDDDGWITRSDILRTFGWIGIPANSLAHELQTSFRTEVHVEISS